MHARQRSCLLGGILVLALLCVSIPSLPRQGPAKAPRPEVAQPGPIEPAPATPPIEAAFEKIQIGMLEEELFALMAPYEQWHTGHHQWPMWAEGHTEVYVTIWPEDGRFPEGLWRVQSMSMKKQVFDKRQRRWVTEWFPENRVILPLRKKHAGLPAVPDIEPMESDDEPKEPAPLEGTWELIQMMTGGARPEISWMRVTFREGNVTWQQKDFDFNETYKLDASKNPKTIDLTVTSEGRLKGQTREGIYRIDGNRLQICMVVRPDARQRPAEFKAGQGSNCMRFVLKRVNE
jgi:uncharacterized protein (TIGR03067 family)